MKKRENTLLTLVDDYIYKSDLNLRSEFNKKPPKDFEKIREIIIKMRKGLL